MSDDLEYDFSEEEIADEMLVMSDGDKTLNERLSASNAMASVNGSFKNVAPSGILKDVSVKNVTFSKE